MTPNHTPGSGDIAERIRQAWLAANPRPANEMPGLTYMHELSLRQKTWLRIEALLALGAYESAVIQFLVPEGWGYQMMPLFGVLRDPNKGYQDSTGSFEAHGSTPAEALLSAIEAATQKDPS